MRKKTALLIIVFLQIGIACNYRVECSEVLQNEANHPDNKQSLEQSNESITNKEQINVNRITNSKVAELSKLSNDELRAEIYKEAVESFRREMDSYKFVLNFSLGALTLIVAIAGVWGGSKIIYMQKDAGKIKKTVNIDDLWTKAGTAYTTGHYEEAAEIWRQINDKFKPNTRQFFNNWGSSLLNWAGTIENKNRRETLASEAIKKYLKAEGFTKGTAAYNIACCYAIRDEYEKCEEWLKTAKETERLLSWKQASNDRDLKKYANEVWFKQIWEK